MNSVFQSTIANKVSFDGIGLHSGKRSNLAILPAKANDGIVFKRVDLKKNNLVKANFKNVTSARLCTTLENNFGVKVSTVEHLLAALYISGIDNVLIEIDNEEVPIMDGSSKDFLDILEKTSLVEQSQKRKYLKILKKLELLDGSRKISIEPNESSLEVNFQLNYDNKLIGNQKNVIDFQKNNLNEVINSRTFCLFEDIEKIKEIGLAKGGSLDNAVVVKNDEILNEGGLRNKKEFVNHKILDLAGDFLLSGHRIIGKVICHQGGHELTNLFLRKVFNSNSIYKLIEFEELNMSKKFLSKELEKLAVSA
jgi:UDP-3-O-[3-hydroxymyristoyl] N-acetylglucosamine deacetylase